MLGRKSIHAEECFLASFIGVDFLVKEDLTGKLPEEWREFNKAYIPIYLAAHPEKSKVAAGLACAFLWTVVKGISNGDIVICPDGSGRYRVAEVAGNYTYHPGGILPHRRTVRWLDQSFARPEMSEELRNSSGSIGTVSNLTSYAAEIEKLIGGGFGSGLTSSDSSIEDPSAFAMEKHLEDFLVLNWAQTELGREFDIYEDEGEQVGQQYPTDTGPIDILAISKDKKELLIIELKKGRASDAVVGQTLRYMGYVKEELAEPGQNVKGIVIALDDDQKLRRALGMVPEITFYRYQVSFRLVRA